MSIFSQALGLDAAHNSQKAAEKQAKGNAKVGTQYGNLFNQVTPQFSGLLGKLGNYDLSSAIEAAMNGLNASPESRVNAFGRGATEAAAGNSAALAQSLKAQGYGDGAVAGATAGNFSRAATQTNQYAQQQMSPESRLQYLMALIQAFGGATGAYSNLLASLSSGVYGQPQVQAQQSPLMTLLGNAAGAYTSGMAGSAGQKAGK